MTIHVYKLQIKPRNHDNKWHLEAGSTCRAVRRVQLNRGCKDDQRFPSNSDTETTSAAEASAFLRVKA